MPELYQLSNWINAVKIKNSLSPNIKIDILQLNNNTGYVLTVSEEVPDKDVNILYRVLIECTLANNWSLSTSEAIGMLNTLGFLCEWVAEPVINETATEQLVTLHKFGWTKIIRSIRPAEIYLLNSTEDVSYALSNIIPNSNYKDWDFLSVNVPYSIEELLSNIKSEDDTETPIIDSEEAEEIAESPTTESE